MPRNAVILLSLGCAAAVFLLIYLFLGLTPENWGFNFPRRLKVIAAILLVATGIGMSSVTFQTITANHILTPSIMGLDSLYLFLQTVIVFTLGSGELTMMTDLPGFLTTMAMMVGSSTALFFFMFRGEEQNVYFLVLVGFVFGTVFNGLASFMQVVIDPSEYSVLEGRIFASFNRINLDLMSVSAAIIVMAALACLLDLRALDVLTLGRNQAVNLGVRYRRVVLRSLIGIALLTSAATVLVGPITFLGILAVSLSRALLRTYRHGLLIAGSVLAATAVLAIGMVVTERVLHFTIPLGVMVNFVGGIYFLYLLLRTKTL